MQCNIDARGKAVRLRIGLALIAVGLLAGFAWLQMLHHTAIWIIALSCLVSGSFVIFESRAGWCAVRAVGFKTKI